MNEMFSLKQRLYQFAQAKSMTLENLCTQSGIGGHIITNGNPAWKKLCQLCATFPDLSAEYLLRCEGSSVRRVPVNIATTHADDMLTQRVDAYIQAANTTKTEILSLSGLKADVLKNRHDKNGIFKECNTTYSNLQKLCDALPNLSAEYLLRGEGSPIRNIEEEASESTETPSPTEFSESAESFPSLLQEYVASRKLTSDAPTLVDLLISSMQETIRTQRELIDSLRAEISLRDQILQSSPVRDVATTVSESVPSLLAEIDTSDTPELS